MVMIYMKFVLSRHACPGSWFVLQVSAFLIQAFFMRINHISNLFVFCHYFINSTVVGYNISNNSCISTERGSERFTNIICNIFILQIFVNLSDPLSVEMRYKKYLIRIIMLIIATPIFFCISICLSSYLT